MTLYRHAVAFALCVATSVVGPGAARADRNRDHIEDLYLQSLDDYDNLRLEEAKKSVRQGLALAEQAGFHDNLVAQLHLQMGLILYVETKDPAAAEDEFVKALEIDPMVRLDPMHATPSIEEAFANAQSIAGAVDPGVGASAFARGDPLIRHEAVEQAYPGVNVPIYVEVPADLPVYRATLFYRTGPGGPYSEVELEPSGTRGFSGYIPSEAVVGDLVEYYVTVTDRRGDELGSVGSAVNPYSVALILGGSSGGGELPDLTLDDELGAYDDRPDRRRRSGRQGTGHLAFGPGTGIGWILGGPLREFKNTEVDPGIADTSFHLYTEMGFYAAEDLMVLLTGRFQFLVSKDQTRVVPMPTLRGRYYYDATPPVRQYVGIGAGWCGFNPENGCVENRVHLADQDYVDTAPKGPAAVGLEGGLAFGSGAVQVMVNLYAYALFPDQTSFQIDPNLVLVIAF